MIWVTGDKHGQLDALELPGYNKIKKKDTLLICGDFGFVWDGSKAEKKALKALSKRKYTIAFVEGCNENYEMLEQYPEVDFCGGRARQVDKNIFQLERGGLYEIEGKKILSFGGGSVDPMTSEMEFVDKIEPNDKQIDLAIENIKIANGQLDLIITHEPPYSVLGCMKENPGDGALINDVLDQIRSHCKFKKWCFGKFHVDKEIPPYYSALFNKLIQIQ